jgi:GDP/UDP-N,N'-diacetylbacillosamine 2-epimerase (hydrolysing)
MRIAFFTTTRAEFGIISSVIEKIQNYTNFESLLFVGGTHLKEEYGNTIEEIKESGISITDTFDYLQEGDTSFAIANSLGYCTIELARIFNKYDFDIISILGDRIELIPITLTALLYNKPIIHWGGGEFTEGVIDNQIRHMITKAANIHFVATEKYAENVIAMGELPERVCVTGSPVIEKFKNVKPIAQDKLFDDLGLTNDKPVVLFTYHPVTIELKLSPLQQMMNLFDALSNFDFQIVITSPNLEMDRGVIIKFLYKQIKLNGGKYGRRRDY